VKKILIQKNAIICCHKIYNTVIFSFFFLLSQRLFKVLFWNSVFQSIFLETANQEVTNGYYF